MKNINIIINKIDKNIENVKYFINDDYKNYYTEFEYSDLIIKDLNYFLGYIFKYNFILIIIILIFFFMYNT